MIAALVACAQFLPGTSSSFTASTGNSGNTVTAIADWTGPTATASVVQKSQGGTSGRIHPGGTFYVYANVSDSGNPASGVASVSASVTNIATVASAAMTSGSWTVDGTTYAYRSALLTAKSTLTSGTYSYAITPTDVAGNAGSTNETVDAESNGAFTGSEFAWDDNGTSTKIDGGDVFAYVYSGTVEPASIVSGWDGSAMSVTVKIVDGTTEPVTILNGAATVPLGTATINGAYVKAGTTVNFTGSTMTASGNKVSITLGTVDKSTNLVTSSPTALPSWTPSATAYDTYGTSASTTAAHGFGGSAFTATNKTGGTAGRIEQGDTFTMTYNLAPDPSSLLSGWSGTTAATVDVKLYDAVTAGTTSDTIAVYDSTGVTLLNPGYALLVGNYISSGTADFTNSTMTLSGNTVTLTLGSTTASTLLTDTAAHAPTFVPLHGLLDLAGGNIWTVNATGSSAVLF